MNWDALGASAELLGAIAVIATIGYLAYQIKQTNKIAKTAAVTDIQRRFDELNTLLLNNAELRDVLGKENLTKKEQELVYFFANFQINIWITVQASFDNDQISRELFDGMIGDVRVAIARWPNIKPAIREWIENFGEMEHWEIFSAYHESMKGEV